MLRSPAACVLALVVLAPAPASAQTNVEEANQSAERGEAHFRAGEYRLALTEFERAYEMIGELAERYLLLHNIGRSHERLSQPEEAVAAYRRYLEEGGASAPNRAQVEARIRDLEASLSGRTSGERGGLGGVGIGGIALIGVGVASAVVAIVTGALAAAAYDDLAQRCSPDGVCPPGSSSDIAAGDALAWSSTILWIVAGVTVAAGIPMLVVDLSSASHPTARLELLGPIARVRF